MLTLCSSPFVRVSRITVPSLRVLGGGEGLVFGIEDGEDGDEVGEFEDLTWAALQAEECEAGFQFARKLQAFDERSHAGTIDIFHIAKIDDEVRHVLVLEKLDLHGAELRRVVERDVAVDVEDGGVAGLASGKIHETDSYFRRSSRNGGKAGRR